MDGTQVNLELARQTLKLEGQAVAALAETIGESFVAAAEAVFGCCGKVVLTGIGKAGIVGEKISATLASTGTQSIFLHPVEALHGDLGRLQDRDVVVALSHSGATEELVRLTDHIKARGAKLIAVTGSADSPLGRHADVVVCYGPLQEACPLGLAPTVSTTCMLALGDALALTVMQMRNFQPEDFAVFHPAGALGRKLLKVEEAMSFCAGERLSVVDDSLTVAAALAEAEKTPRRTGAMLLVDSQSRLSGILTDADLRRALITGGEKILNEPVAELMTRDPKHIHVGELASEAMATLNKYRIDELPVLDDAGRPVGVIDVQDLLGIKTVSHDAD
ncbi:MAG: KpsF/GutQ family sugar-phosphate isomerase [Planctomycetota bacterium]|nr:KpsF/GutQ family sugar-phosphate isomerase [Planctomycetota bacterium]